MKKIIISFGNISIRDEDILTSIGKEYTIFVDHGDEKSVQQTVRTFDEDFLILKALELKYEGSINGSFARCASSILDI